MTVETDLHVREEAAQSYERQSFERLQNGVGDVREPVPTANDSVYSLAPDSEVLDNLIEILSSKFEGEDQTDPYFWKGLGDEFLSECQREDCISYLAAAVCLHTKAVSLASSSAESEVHAACLNRLGLSLLRHFLWSGDLDDVERSITAMQEALNLTPRGHAAKPAYLVDLGNSLRARSERLGNLDDLERSIQVHLEASSYIPDEHTDKPMCLNNLGNSFRVRFQRLGDLKDVEQSIATREKAVNLTPDGHARKPMFLNNLGNSIALRFEHCGDPRDIDWAVDVHEHAVDLTPSRDVDRPINLVGLGHSLRLRFQQSGKPSDLRRSIEAYRGALDLIPGEHANRPMFLTNFGLALMLRFERFGNVSDVDQSIAVHQQVVDLTPIGHVQKPLYMNNLGISLRSRFDRTWSLYDIEQSITAHQQAVDLTPDGHAMKPLYLNNLGGSFMRCFERWGDRSALDQSTAAFRRAIDLIPDGHIMKAVFFNNMGCALKLRYQYSEESSDVEQAITAHQQAVDLTRDGNPGKLMLLDNLGNSLRIRYEYLGHLSDMEQSITAHQKAVELCPNEHTRKSSYLNNLQSSLMPRDKQWHWKALRIGEHSMAILQQAIDLAPDGHIELPLYSHNLALLYWKRFESEGISDDIKKAIDLAEAGATSKSGLPSMLLSAARLWAYCSFVYYEHPSLEAHKIIMSLIPRLVWLGADVSCRYQTIDSVNESDAVVEAAAAALSHQELVLAVEWLEQGRSIIWGQLLDLRTPMADVQALRPDLAQELKKVRTLLETIGTMQNQLLEPDAQRQPQQEMRPEEQARRRRRLAARYEEVLASIRGVPGLQDFLRPKEFNCLRDVAQYGPVVLVNIHITRCDALIVQKDHAGPLRVHLERFTYEEAEHLRHSLIGALDGADVRERGSRRSMTARGTDVIPYILGKLWEGVAKPVLDALGYITDSRLLPVDGLPHLTWCLTGSLTFLPLHAAGLYATPGQPKIYEYAVSSFTPSLTALLEACKRGSSNSPTILAISQPSTPGQRPLPGTVREIEAIKQKFDSDHTASFQWLNGEEATVDATITAMRNHSWCHLACHGVQRTQEPTRSAFALHDGELDLTRIMSSRFESADLAFLSACQTATGDEKRPEESVHLAAGMLMAGYRTVFATMWSIGDNDAPLVAEAVYSYLLEERKREDPDMKRRSSAAYALHHATARLRERVGVEAFLKWVPFIHIGV